MSYTKADKERIAKFRHIGCIVSRIYFGEYEDYDVHHITSGGRRMGNQFTIPLSPWLHRGVVKTGLTEDECEAYFGPSLAKSKSAFTERFCSELELLKKCNELIGQYK